MNIPKLFFSRFKNGGEDSKPLNLYQYKFLRYKQARNRIYPLDMSKIKYGGEEGLVSIIMPVYNGGDMLRDALDSVLEQTYRNFELIVINDGSTDNSSLIAHEYAKRDTRVTVTDQENMKIPRTLSRGFSMAKGEFYTWTSADNIMPRNYIETMVEALQSDPSLGMVYGNMRLIDAKGKIYRRHGWYEKPLASGNVILPNNAYELNTYANNTIGAAFMYRAEAGGILGEYSRYKHTLEDYDYWMRLNSLFKLRHIKSEEPVYFYRWHNKSLTAQDKKLGITKSRYKLMVLDDFRRDFYLTPLLWAVTGGDEADGFKRALKDAGHILIDNESMSRLYFGREARNLCVVSFDGTLPEYVPHGAIKVCVMPNTAFVPEGFDVYISQSRENLKHIDGYKGWFYAENLQAMFSLLDAKIKNELLYRMEGVIESEKRYEKRISAIVCTTGVSISLSDCLESLCNQDYNPDNFEIILVNNSPSNESVRDVVDKMRKTYPQVEINYLTAPLCGLSFARNAGLWEARGEYILYIDDDAVAERDVLSQTVRAFDEHPEAGVIGGQIILETPNPTPSIVTKETRGLWSELIIDGNLYRTADNYGEFPYGANFAVRTQSLMQIGGFRCTYGRIGDNYGGGEETLVCFMMKEIEKTVGLNPLSKVYHRVDFSRYTNEHIEKTAYAGVMVQYQLRRDLYAPQDWSDRDIAARAEKFDAGKGPDSQYKNAVARAFRDVMKQRAKDYEFLRSFGKQDENRN